MRSTLPYVVVVVEDLTPTLRKSNIFHEHPTSRTQPKGVVVVVAAADSTLALDGLPLLVLHT